MRIAIVGAGSAGLFTAFYLSMLSPDSEITIFDRSEPGKAATDKAAGMLAPIHELDFQELDLLKAGLESRQIYRTEIANQLGDIGLIEAGTLQIGLNQDDLGYLKRQFEFQQKQALDVEWLAGDALRAHEPFLNRNIHFGIWAKDDIQVDNRLLVNKLLTFLRSKGIELHANSEIISFRSIQKDEIEILVNGEASIFESVIFTTGCTIGELSKLLPFKTYPVRGEMLALKPLHNQHLSKTIRVFSKVLGNAYIVPKSGRVLCGSTSEEQGMQAVNTAGGILDILRKCHAAIPGIYEMEIIETWAGLRPSTLNRQPILGKFDHANVFYLNGLYRHGVLLGPLLGREMANLVVNQSVSATVLPFFHTHYSD